MTLKNNYIILHIHLIELSTSIFFMPGLNMPAEMGFPRYEVNSHSQLNSSHSSPNGMVMWTEHNQSNMPRNLPGNSPIYRPTCSLCNQVFLSQKDLRRHERIHTGERPFTCKICQRKFSRSDGLYVHIRNIHHIYEDLANYVLGPDNAAHQ